MSNEPELPMLYSMDRQIMLRVMNLLWEWCMVHENNGHCKAPDGMLSVSCAEWYRDNVDRVGLDII